MKKALFILAGFFMVLFATIGISRSTYADPLAINSRDVKKQTDKTAHDATYAFSLKAGKNSTMRFFYNVNGEETDYSQKILASTSNNSLSAAIHPTSDAYSGKVGVYIYNAGFYKGKQIDVRITYSWQHTVCNSQNITPIIHPHIDKASGRIYHYYANMSYEAKWELLYAGEPIQVNMSATIGDVEEGETCGIKANVGSIASVGCYYNSDNPSDQWNCKVHYLATQSWHYAHTGAPACFDMLSGSLRFELKDVSSFSQRYIFYHDRANYTEAGTRSPQPSPGEWDGWEVHNREKSEVFDRATQTWTPGGITGGTFYRYASTADEELVTYGWYFFDASPIGYYEVPAPTKGLALFHAPLLSRPAFTSYDRTEKYVMGVQPGISSAISGGQETYGISQYVPPMNATYNKSDFYYQSFVIQDTLPSNANAKAKYVSAKVIDADDTDQNSKFNITESNGTVTFTAKSSALKTDDFYDNTYIFVINIEWQWANNTATTFTLDNQARAIIQQHSDLKAKTKHSNAVRLKSERKKIHLVKQWDDKDDADKLRPSTLSFEVLADYYMNGRVMASDLKVGTIKLTSPNWSGDAWIDAGNTTPTDGSPGTYQYRIKETSVPSGYASTTKTSGDTTTITNKHTPATTSITIAKTWDDDSDRDKKRPTSIQADVLDGSNVVKTVTISAANSWKTTVTGLQKNRNGVAIHYTVKEKTIGSGYTSTCTETSSGNWTIKNTRPIDTVSLTITKTWDDDSDRDRKRPASIQADVLDGTSVVRTVTISPTGGWKATVTGLPKNKNGVAIHYTVKEKTISSGYTSTCTETSSGNWTIKNTRPIEKTSITITKTWDDDSDRDRQRPSSIQVDVLDGTSVVQTVTLDAANGWKKTVSGLTKNKNGVAIHYTVKEKTIGSGYTSTCTETSSGNWTIKNTRPIDRTSVTIVKVWNDDDNRDAKRPSSIQVDVLDGEDIIQSVTLDAANGWKATVAQLIKNREGQPINYTVKEHTVGNGYTTEYTKKAINNWEIKNTRPIEKTEASVVHIFVDDNNADGLRPSSTTAVLYRENEPLIENGKEVTVDLSDPNTWTDTVKDLIKNNHGVPYNYHFVLKEEIPEYTTTYEQQGNKTIITSVHISERVSVSLTKNWDDDNNADGIRPEKATFLLKANGEAAGQYTVYKSSGWHIIVDDLLKNREGIPIKYEWEEQPITGYTPAYNSSEYDTVVTNIHKASRINLFVRQEWEDHDDADGIRPDSVTATLYADGAPATDSNGNVITLDLTSKDGWDGMVKDLLEKKDGKPIKYSFAQTPVPDGYTTDYSRDGETYVITSKHDPEQVTLYVAKEWDDNNDGDGIRPDSVVIDLMDGSKKVDSVTLSEDNGWSDSVENLQKNRKGKPIQYEWQEQGIPEGYAAEYEVDGYDTVVVNKHEHEKTSATLKKLFEDADDADGLRPENIDFNLLANGEEIGVYTLSKDNDWTVVVDNLDMNKKGEAINYTWEEIKVPEGYTSETEKDGSLTTITNKHQQDTRDLHLKFQYDDDNNRDGIRPGSVTVTLEADGEELDSYTLDEKNNVLDLEGLPKNKHGKPIHYTFVQKSTPDQYNVSYDEQGNTIYIVDKHIPARVTVSVKKVWKDKKNALKTRPKTIYAVLMVNGKKSGKIFTLSQKTHWKAAVSNLYKCDDGKELTYGFSEVNIPEGYKSKTTISGLTTTITNTLLSSKASKTEGSTQSKTQTKEPTSASASASASTAPKTATNNKSFISPQTGGHVMSGVLILLVAACCSIAVYCVIKRRALR